MKAFQLTLVLVIAACCFTVVVLTVKHLQMLMELSNPFIPFIIILIFGIIGAFIFYLFIETWYNLFLK